MLGDRIANRTPPLSSAVELVLLNDCVRLRGRPSRDCSRMTPACFNSEQSVVRCRNHAGSYTSSRQQQEMGSTDGAAGSDVFRTAPEAACARVSVDRLLRQQSA